MLVLLVALVVLGPDKLPKAARQAGNVIRELRKISADVRSEVDSVINAPDTEEPAVEPPSTEKHPGTSGFELVDQQDATPEAIPVDKPNSKPPSAEKRDGD